MSHLQHSWFQVFETRKPYFLGGHVIETKFHCYGCREELIKTSKPTGRLELLLVLLMAVVGAGFFIWRLKHP